MGSTGLIAISIDQKVNPDIAFFSILLKENVEFLSVVIIILAVSLTISTIDTLINAISSIAILDGKKIYKTMNKYSFLLFSRVFIIILSIISLIIAS